MPYVEYMKTMFKEEDHPNNRALEEDQEEIHGEDSQIKQNKHTQEETPA